MLTGEGDGEVGEKFMHACKAGDLNDVKSIVEIIGEEVNGVKDSDGKTGAYFAAFHGREDVVVYLLRKGATQMDVKNGRKDFNNQLKTIVGEDNMKKLQQGDQFKGTLYLSFKSINDEGCSILAIALKRMTALNGLYLYNNQIGDNGIEHLSKALPKMKALNVLRLYNNQIGDNGIEHLSKALPKMKALNGFVCIIIKLVIME